MAWGSPRFSERFSTQLLVFFSAMEFRFIGNDRISSAILFIFTALCSLIGFLVNNYIIKFAVYPPAVEIFVCV